MNLSYWGFNQYIIQRALAAPSLREAQKGIAFAAFLKLLMPIIVVLPGIAAVLILPDLAKPDQAYPQLMALMPSGLKGLIFAALVAAILSSLASMTNSVATLFTMDLYAQVKPAESQQHYVLVGRSVSLLSLVIALFTAKPLLGDFDQAFQYIQEFTGFFSAGYCCAVFYGHVLEKNHGRRCAAGGGRFPPCSASCFISSGRRCRLWTGSVWCSCCVWAWRLWYPCCRAIKSRPVPSS